MSGSILMASSNPSVCTHSSSHKTGWTEEGKEGYKNPAQTHNYFFSYLAQCREEANEKGK